MNQPIRSAPIAPRADSAPAPSVFRLALADVVTAVTIYPTAATRDDLPEADRDRACRAFEGPGYMVLDRVSPPDPPLPPAPGPAPLPGREAPAAVDPETWQLYLAAAEANRRDREAVREHDRLHEMEEAAEAEMGRTGEAAREASMALAARLAALGLAGDPDVAESNPAVVLGDHVVTLAETALAGRPLRAELRPIWRPAV